MGNLSLDTTIIPGIRKDFVLEQKTNFTFKGFEKIRENTRSFSTYFDAGGRLNSQQALNAI